MTFLMDRNVDYRVVKALRRDYDWVVDSELIRSPGDRRPDTEVLKLALQTGRVLLTQDRDFDENAQLKALMPHSSGVVLIRLFSSGNFAIPVSSWAPIIANAFAHYSAGLSGNVLEVWCDTPLLRWFREAPWSCPKCQTPYIREIINNAKCADRVVRQGYRKAMYHIAILSCNACAFVGYFVDNVAVI